jgi:hypothetical protein
MRMFNMRPIAPVGGRSRKNTWKETGLDEYADRSVDGVA